MMRKRIFEDSVLSRRNFIVGGSLATTAVLAGCGQPQAVTSAAQPVPGIQLYTVREPMARNMAGTLARIAEIGYKEVEFAGYFDKSPAEVRAILSDTGLAAPSTHVGHDVIRDNPGPAIEAGAEVGHDWLVLNWLAPDQRETIDQYKRWAEVMNRFGEQARAAGMKAAWHNHDFELMPIDGTVPLDILMEECDPDLVKFELDLFWAEKAGTDILALLARDPDRFTMCHVKDMDESGNMADVGTGVIDFRSIFASDVSRFQHFFIERDDAARPFKTAAVGHATLDNVLQAVSESRQ
ncbi:sugar phosphate isomerase/epimerase family protein [Aquisalinus flavus]|uniref:Sugar phosphate isomerase n=1 Tax=Aquisalinus flavus TaxID=1526572 RepID=A0A8J2Y5H9_9PROT|nr:sugar phosphate isomerase/epimerase [Aquisalinus flavus]MBD0425773.1 sugar phosphate isomerase/epimerase [Aquisalinus flavus]UNE48619.1 sugar phosphate isomerase/epimerase [Aquisalinus flavus]GGD13409.1 sugar phosphate isomerase [Aquisalinus flavus]